MNDRSFDSVARAFARGGSRRVLMKSLVGLGGVVAAGTALHDADAARRGYSGPPIPPKPTEVPPSPCFGLSCNGQCCGPHETICCNDFCCAGTCHDTQCCSPGQSWCPDVGCCDGACIDDNCCAHRAVCNGNCCGGDGFCCAKEDGSLVCTQIGRCCSNADCNGGACDSEGFCH